MKMSSRAVIIATLVIVAVLAAAAAGFALGAGTRPGPLPAVHPPASQVHISGLQQAGSAPALCLVAERCPVTR